MTMISLSPRDLVGLISNTYWHKLLLKFLKGLSITKRDSDSMELWYVQYQLHVTSVSRATYPCMSLTNNINGVIKGNIGQCVLLVFIDKLYKLYSFSVVNNSYFHIPLI